MKICLIRGSGVEQNEVDSVFHSMKARQIEAVELKREAKAEVVAQVLRETDLLLTLGGDGTFRAGARVAAPRDIPILGVNHGHLGFLTEIEAEEMQAGLSRYVDGEYRIEARTKLEVTLARKGQRMVHEIGLNEVVVDHSGEARILRLEIDVGGQRVGVIDADGAIVATASGSTAYALASGGPILEPSLEDLVLVPMSPFALTVRDLAMVAESNVRFGPGLNLLTGETGSGKSLIIDALSLALGARGGADQVRHGAERASIEADFDLVVLQREIGKRGAARVDG